MAVPLPEAIVKPGTLGWLDYATWTDAASVDNSAVPLPFNNGNASLQVEDFAARTARYVRACR